MNIDRQLEINEARHYKADERYLDRVDKAHALIGELMRDGQTVYYINLRNGKIKEGKFFDLSDYLIRNRYV